MLVLLVAVVCGMMATTAQAAAIGDTAYDSLVDALAAAKSGDTVTVEGIQTLDEDATVPSGVTLLLKCENSTTINPDGTSGSNKGPDKEAYTTLTIADSTTLTVEGTLVVNAYTGVQNGGGYDQGLINGGWAQIVLDGTIDVNGGTMKNYGSVIGSGKVNATSANIYDRYEVINWRGGTYAYYCVGFSYAVLGSTKSIVTYPMLETNCHAIETTLNIDSGSSFYGLVKMYADGSWNTTDYKLIGSDNAMIQLSSNGGVTKSYDGARSIITLTGGATFSGSTMSISAKGYNMSLSTKSFVYPIDGDIDFVLKSGSYTVSNSFKMLPGSTVELLSGATLTVSSGKKLALYDETFEDTCTYGSDPYPSGRGAATLTMHGGSKLTVSGSIGGHVVMAADVTATNSATVTVSGTSVTTKEMTGQSTSASYTFNYAMYYTVAFLDTDGDTCYTTTATSGSTVTYDGRTPSKTGCTFVGWSATKDGTAVDSITVGDASAVYYPVFQKNKYVVNFLVGGENYGWTEVYYGEQVVESFDEPTQDGYKFLGWSTSQNGSVIDLAKLTITENTTLYAVFEQITYSVTLYDKDNKASSEQIAEGATFKFPSLEAAEGYTFQGWSTTQGGVVEYCEGATLEITSAMTFYPVFQKNTYTVTFYNGDSRVTSQTVEHNNAATEPAAPAKTGYRFLGWSTTPNGSTIDLEKLTITENTDLYAVFEQIKYTVTFYDTDGSQLDQVEAAAGNCPYDIPSKTGYIFKGWATSRGGSVVYDTDTALPITGDASFYAVFEAEQYTVKLLNADGSEILTDTSSYGAVYAIPRQEDTVSSTFKGWATTANGDVVYQNNAVFTVSGPVTLYAVYSQNTYTVTFMNGDTAYDTQTVKHGERANAPADPTKDGYKFLGWAKSENGTTTKDFTITGNTSFYAVFEKIVTSVTTDNTVTVTVATSAIEVKTTTPTTDANSTGSADTGESETPATAKVEAAVTIPTTTQVSSSKDIVISIKDAIKSAIEKAPQTNSNTTTDADTTTETDSTTQAAEVQADVSVTIPQEVVAQMETAESLTIETGVADVTFDKEALSKIVDANDGVTLQTQSLAKEDLNEAQQAALQTDDAVIIDLNLTDSNNQKVTFSDDNSGNTGAAQVTVPFNAEEGKTYAVYYIDDFGNKEKVDSKYENGYMTFTATHFSVYVSEEYVDTGEETKLTVDNFKDYTKDLAKVAITSNRTFTYTCSNACVVAYTLDGGTTYTRLTATAVEGKENTYSFTVDSDVDLEKISIAVALKGDIDLNGAVNASDAFKMRRAAAGYNVSATALGILVADVNTDGSIAASDAFKVRRAAAGYSAYSW
jgi:uncharacterized repeat protein (TIGR02543 family)